MEPYSMVRKAFALAIAEAKLAEKPSESEVEITSINVLTKEFRCSYQHLVGVVRTSRGSEGASIMIDGDVCGPDATYPGTPIGHMFSAVERQYDMMLRGEFLAPRVAT